MSVCGEGVKRNVSERRVARDDSERERREREKERVEERQIVVCGRSRATENVNEAEKSN